MEGRKEWKEGKGKVRKKEGRGNTPDAFKRPGGVVNFFEFQLRKSQRLPPLEGRKVKEGR